MRSPPGRWRAPRSKPSSIRCTPEGAFAGPQRRAELLRGVRRAHQQRRDSTARRQDQPGLRLRRHASPASTTPSSSRISRAARARKADQRESLRELLAERRSRDRVEHPARAGAAGAGVSAPVGGQPIRRAAPIDSARGAPLAPLPRSVSREAARPVTAPCVFSRPCRVRICVTGLVMNRSTPEARASSRPGGSGMIGEADQANALLGGHSSAATPQAVCLEAVGRRSAEERDGRS